MNYRLVVVTHGAALNLDRVLSAFLKNARPAPTDLVAVVDGPGRLPPVEHLWRIKQHPRQLGFCETLVTAWAAASEPGVDYVFWLENDFLLTRYVELEMLAAELDADLQLAQMALMRNAVNSDERRAGGLYESRRDQFDRRFGPSGFPSLRHTAYFTTNPSLMRRDFIAANPWPDYPSECEGKFGIDLVDRGYRFGVWGDGSPWCTHVGDRDGFGY